MTLVPLPAFADNHIWMLQEGRDAIVVNPGDAKLVSDALERGDLQLAAILVTRRPRTDHVGHIANFLPVNARSGAAGEVKRRANPFLRSRCVRSAVPME